MSNSKSTSRFIRLLDALGVGASSLCVVHCLLMPLLVGILPFYGAQYLASPGAHKMLAGFVVLFSVTAIVPGWMRHKNRLVLSCMVIGLSVVLFATFGASSLLGDYWEIPLISIGNLFVISAHILNRRQLGCDNHSHR